MQTGTASIRFERPPRILQAASVVGPKEAEGHLAHYLMKLILTESVDRIIGNRQRVSFKSGP